MSTKPSGSDLTSALIELEQHVSESGWDQPAALYCLADRHDLIAREPQLSAALGISSDTSAGSNIVPIQQEWSEGADGIDAALAVVAWPSAVQGAAIVLERYLLPPEAEHDVLADPNPAEVVAAVADHPDREEVRLVAGVMRDGREMCVLRLRSRDRAEDVLSGPDLLPNLTAALRTTFDA